MRMGRIDRWRRRLLLLLLGRRRATVPLDHCGIVMYGAKNDGKRQHNDTIFSWRHPCLSTPVVKPTVYMTEGGHYI